MIWNILLLIVSFWLLIKGALLPELVTTIVSTKKGEQDLLIGNIIESNIFNIYVVLDIPAVIFKTIFPSSSQILDLILLIIFLS